MVAVQSVAMMYGRRGRFAATERICSSTEHS